MRRCLSYTVEKTDEGKTVERYLKERGYSHQVIVQLKKTSKGIRRNGVWAYTNERVQTGDRLDICLEEEECSDQIEPVRLPFGVVYEDEDLLVVDKPANMPVHPSMNNHDNTLANAVLWYSRQKNEQYPYRCINRLDRDTTGLLIIAKNALSAAGLCAQMRDRRIRRTYLALVTGQIREPGVIDQPIARCEGSTILRMVDRERGERALTHYEPVRWGEGWTLVKCRLETGRTHQIRVHMSFLGHPLPGDFLYNPKNRDMARQPLHSWCLAFTHPVTGQRLEFTSELPEDMLAYMKNRPTVSGCLSR